MRIHPVFHVSLLEPALKNAKLSPVRLKEESKDPEYDVKKVLDKQDINSKPHYLIKWLGYKNSENTWEPETNLSAGDSFTGLPSCLALITLRSVEFLKSE